MSPLGLLPLAMFVWTDAEPAEPAAPSAAKRVYVVAAIGDSLTDPKSHGGKYLELLREACPKSRFDTYGKGGQMVNQMRKRFARDVLGEGEKKEKPRYTHALVLGGIGDILSNETAGRTAEKIEGDLGAMYTMAKKRGVAVVALTLPPWGGASAYNEARHTMSIEVSKWIRERSTAGAVDAVADIYPLLSCGEPAHLCGEYGWPDKLHWNAKGHAVVGKALRASVFSNCE
jgi:hypothetical protein